MKFEYSSLLNSLLDGTVIGLVAAILVIVFRGPIKAFSGVKQEDSSNRQKESADQEGNKRGLQMVGGFFETWAFMVVVIGSASYALCSGYGRYGIINGVINAVQEVDNYFRFAWSTLLNMVILMMMGGVVWTVIWIIGDTLLKIIFRSKAQSNLRWTHGTIFGLFLGGLMGLITSLNHAINGKIVGPIELLFFK